MSVRFGYMFALRSIPAILSGVPMTILITVVAMALGLVLGFFVALCRIHKIPVLSQLAAVYVSYIRGTPLIVQLYLVFYVLPVVITHGNPDAVNIPPLVVALVCYTLSTAAYLSRAVSAALSSVELSQLEAAYSVGESYWQGMRRIIIPQAFVTALPTLTNSLLELLKGTSLVFTVMVIDLMARTKIVAAAGYRYIEAYVFCTVIYWILCFSIEKLCKLKGGALDGRKSA
jgi:L-cystine transport system permease protein